MWPLETAGSLAVQLNSIEDSPPNQCSGEWTVSAELPIWSNLRQVNCKGSSITTVCRHIAAYCIALACYRLVCIVIHSDGLANIAF